MPCPLKHSFFVFKFPLHFYILSLEARSLISWRPKSWRFFCFEYNKLHRCTQRWAIWFTEWNYWDKWDTERRSTAQRWFNLPFAQDGKWRKKVYQGYKLTRFLGDMLQSSQKERTGSKNCTFGCLFTNSHIWCVLAIISMQKWKASITILPSRA